VTQDEGALRAELEAIEKEWASRVLGESDLAFPHMIRGYEIAKQLGENDTACALLCVTARSALPPRSYPQRCLCMSRALKMVRIATRDFPANESAWYTAANVLEGVAQRLVSREQLLRAEIVARAAAAAYREHARIDVDTKYPGQSLRIGSKCEELAKECAHARKHPASGSRIRI
jgi:hypothetical protein